MFKNKFVCLSLVAAGFLFTGCQWFQKVGNPPKVSFNFSEAEAVGGRNINAERSASGDRAVDHSNRSALVKIMEDGNLESAISFTLPDTSNLSEANRRKTPKYGKLKEVFLPPEDSGCTDVYLLFDFPTYFITEDPERPGHAEHWGLSSFICIHEDNSWTDILYDSPWGVTVYNIDSKQNIHVTPDGTLYVLFNAGGWEYHIRKYDPKTRKSSEFCSFGRRSPLIEETDSWTLEDWENNRIDVNVMKLSKDLKWAYIQIEKSGKQYIHAVSMDNPKISYDKILGNGSDLCCWDYEEKSDKLYYLVREKDSDNAIVSTKVYKSDSDGQNEELVKDLGVRDCDSLFAVTEDTVWIKYRSLDSGDNENAVIENLATGEIVASIPLPSDSRYYDCRQNFVVKDDALYFCYSANHDFEKECDGNNFIFRVAVADGSVVKYMDMLTEKNNIAVSNWNVGDSKLYITGWNGDEPANYEINLDGSGEAKKIAEGQAFTCIGGLR